MTHFIFGKPALGKTKPSWRTFSRGLSVVEATLKAKYAKSSTTRPELSLKSFVWRQTLSGCVNF